MFRCRRLHLQQTAIALTACAAFLFAAAASFAQVAYDAQIPFEFSSPNLSNPTGIAVAPDGTIYVGDIKKNGTTAHLVRITPTTGTVGGASGSTADIAATGARLTPTGVTMKIPTAVVVDSTGALYVADATGNIVFRIASPESSTSPAATAIPYGTGTETPTALAVDSANNLYIADQTQGAIYEVTGGVATQLLIGSGFKPAGLAVDSAGDVYFADTATNDIYEYNASTKATGLFLSSSGGTNFSFGVLPVGMGVDPAGDVYIMDSGNDRIVEAVSGSDTFTVPFSSIASPGSLALSSTGNIYLTDDSNDLVDEIYYNNNPVNFGSVNAGTASPEITLNYNFISSQSQVNWYQAMQGDNTGEFSNPGSGTYPCGTGQYTKTVAAGTQCNFTMEVTYQASTPGLRSGADGLTDGNNDILAVPTEGITVAGSLALYPGTQSVLQSTQTLYEPQAVAASGNGNWLFVADEGGVSSGGGYSYPNPAVWAYPVTNDVISSSPSLVGSGFTNPIGMAIDAGGNLYVADYSGYVRKVPPGSNHWGSAGTYLSLPVGMLNHPIALAIDPSGNLYIGDSGSLGPMATAANPGYIVEVPADGGPAIKLNYTVNGTPVVYPEGLTTDAYGNLYIADGGDASNQTNTGGVDVVTASTGVASAISFGGYGYNNNAYSLNEPSSIGFDAAGDLYVLDSYNERVLVEPINYSESTPVPDSNDVTLLGYGNSGITNELVTPSSMIVWPGGQNITIADLGYTPASGPASPVQVVTLQAMNAATVEVTPSGAVTGVNVGNQEITFQAPNLSPNNASFSLSGCGSAGSTVEPGVVNPCTATITYSGTKVKSATFILNGNTADDYSGLGNLIPVVSQPSTPLAQVTAGPLVTIPTGYSVTVTITNVGGNGGGTDPLSITYIELHNPHGASWAGGTCHDTENLDANASCTVVVDLNNNGRYQHGNVRFTDNSGDVSGTIQKECTYVDYEFFGITGGGYSGFCRGDFEDSVEQGPITTNVGNSNTLNAPGSTQTKVGIVNGALDSQLGSAGLRPGNGMAPSGNAAPPQSQSQPVSTIQTGSTPQAAGSYLPLGLVQPSFIAPDDTSAADSSAANDDSNVNDDSSTSDQDGTTNRKKKSHESDGANSGSGANANASGDSAPQQ